MSIPVQFSHDAEGRPVLTLSVIPVKNAEELALEISEKLSYEKLNHELKKET